MRFRHLIPVKRHLASLVSWDLIQASPTAPKTSNHSADRPLWTLRFLPLYRLVTVHCSRVFVNSIPLGMRKAVVNAAHVEWAAGITNAVHNFSRLDLEQGCGHGFNSVRVQTAPQLFRHDGLNLSAPVLSMLLICINKYKLVLQCQLR